MNATLSEIEIIGLQVVCASRCGLLEALSCSDCTAELQEERNCLGYDVEKPVHYLQGVGEFYACPMQCIPSSVYSFLEQYDYQEKYPSTALHIRDENPRYLTALNIYESTMAKMKKQKQETAPSKDNISKMRSFIKK